MNVTEVPDTRYAMTSDGMQLAYQVFGHGPRDIVDRGQRELKGVPGPWHLYALVC